MKNYFLLITLLLLGTSCNLTSPQKYIEVAVLNTNTATSQYRPIFFKLLHESKTKNAIIVFKDDKKINNATAVQYVEEKISNITNNMAKVKKLKSTKETADLLNASLELQTYIKEVMSSDYISIANMIDESKPEQDITIATQKMFEKHDAAVNEKMQKMNTLALSYAKKHNIDLRLY